MKTIEVKTNIMCSSCIAHVTPLLNNLLGENKWQVDTTNSKKILTVTSEDLSEDEVIKAVEQAGYKAGKTGVIRMYLTKRAGERNAICIHT